MEQYVKYLRKSRFDRDYADLSIEETLKRHEAILDKLASQRGYYIAKTYYEVVSGSWTVLQTESEISADATTTCGKGIHYFSVKLDNIKGESGNLNVYTPTLAGRIRNDPMMKRTETIPYRRVKGGYQ